MKYETMVCHEQDNGDINEKICAYNLAHVPTNPCRRYGWFGEKVVDENGTLIGGCRLSLAGI